MPGPGAAGLVTAPYLQSGIDSFPGPAAEKDPTGLTGLLPGKGGFRCCSAGLLRTRQGPEHCRLTAGGPVERPAARTPPATCVRRSRTTPCVTPGASPGGGYRTRPSKAYGCRGH